MGYVRTDAEVSRIFAAWQLFQHNRPLSGVRSVTFIDKVLCPMLLSHLE